MKKELRNFMALSASVALVALTGCGAIADIGGGDEDPEEEASQNVEEVPALSDIDDQMWGSMEEAGNVTITADVTELASVDAESAQMFEEMLGGETSDIQFYGSLNETATGMRVGDEEFLRNFGENGVYISADAIFNMLGTQNLGLSGEEQQQFDDVAAELAGTWFDFSSEVQPEETDDVSVVALFDDLRQSWDGEDAGVDSPVERDQISDEGTHEVREEQDVWVYTGDEEGRELVLEANQDSPKFVSLATEDGSIEFSDWGETQAPQQPEESDIMTEQDIEQQLSGTAGSSSTSGGSGSTEPSTEATEPESGSSNESNPVDHLTSVPGVGTFDCSGPVVGDPGQDDPNDNYTDEEEQAVQEACDRTGAGSSSNTSGSDSSSDGDVSGNVLVPGVSKAGSVDCDGPIPGDEGFSDPNNNFTADELEAVQDACGR